MAPNRNYITASALHHFQAKSQVSQPRPRTQPRHGRQRATLGGYSAPDRLSSSTGTQKPITIMIWPKSFPGDSAYLLAVLLVPHGPEKLNDEKIQRQL